MVNELWLVDPIMLGRQILYYFFIKKYISFLKRAMISFNNLYAAKGNIKNIGLGAKRSVL